MSEAFIGYTDSFVMSERVAGVRDGSVVNESGSLLATVSSVFAPEAMDEECFCHPHRNNYDGKYDTIPAEHKADGEVNDPLDRMPIGNERFADAEGHNRWAELSTARSVLRESCLRR